MRTAGIIMAYPLVEESAQMGRCQRNQQVEALPPQRADKPLTQRIGLRTLWGCFQHLESQVSYALVKRLREDTVAVMQEKAVAVVSRYRLTQLLQRPRRRRVHRDIGVQNAVGRMFHHDKHGEEAKGGRDDHAEVTRDDRLGMIADKGAPAVRCRALAWPPVERLRHVSTPGAGRPPQAQLQQQFIGHALLPPGRVVTSHLADERLQLRRNRWSSGL